MLCIEARKRDVHRSCKLSPLSEMADAKEDETTKLIGMQGDLGTDIALLKPGHYHFVVDTKLADSKKRKFEHALN